MSVEEVTSIRCTATEDIAAGDTVRFDLNTSTVSKWRPTEKELAMHFSIDPSAPDGKVTCVCPIGRDHDVDEMPEAMTDTVVDPGDRFVGMADQPAEDVIE
jgi:hypothetical protein